ncbi:MAG: ATP phosphoribosyltransferase regulatory subunit [Boseongicola sp. SB0664_bin_43]|uniref:ATP phosphoribosyltransferase regulatory subunit n=1 Tax=Boseongicola sp. SB0664_bin_43 TaxID=2604844 RepID=A0A6B0Y3B7_9RHOB|nr:ATP phosphoribosyltransferase regulatory subunit [Boseongicola sp. SB0664_bin_43]
MTDKSAIRVEADRLRALFEARSAEVFETGILQPAGVLLDLYGEDIRARAFTTHDPLRGEMMLRPDFTLPLVQRHVAEGRKDGRYTYAGEVFRRQEDDPDRDAEYLQVGYEIFGGEESVEADAEVFAAFAEILAPLDLRPATGDIGLLRAAIEGLETSAARQAALMHHLWRPKRFRGLLNRYGQVTPAAESPDAGSGIEIGLRTRAEVAARVNALETERSVPPLEAEVIGLIDALLGIRGKAPSALAELRETASGLPSILPAIELLAARFAALDALGVDVDLLDFEVSYGRTNLEYYDGFVFGFFAGHRPDLPPVASGGRYDALSRAIGGAAGRPAVGGVLRPGLMLNLGSGS